MMTRRQLFTASLLLLALAMIIFMPLRTIMGSESMSARKVEGIIWDGSIRDLKIGRLPIGDVNARLHFLPLLIARAEISFSRGDAPFAPGVSGSVTRRVGGFSVNALNASVPVADLFAPLPADTIELQDFSAEFIAGRCAEASGSARLMFASAVPGFELANGLLATPRCDRGQLFVPLVSQSAMERVDIRFSADGTYSTTIFLEGDRGAQTDALILAGFRPVAGGYRMARKGRF